MVFRLNIQGSVSSASTAVPTGCRDLDLHGTPQPCRCRCGRPSGVLTSALQVCFSDQRAPWFSTRGRPQRPSRSAVPPTSVGRHPSRCSLCVSNQAGRGMGAAPAGRATLIASVLHTGPALGSMVTSPPISLRNGRTALQRPGRGWPTPRAAAGAHYPPQRAWPRAALPTGQKPFASSAASASPSRFGPSAWPAANPLPGWLACAATARTRARHRRA